MHNPYNLNCYQDTTVVFRKLGGIAQSSEGTELSHSVSVISHTWSVAVGSARLNSTRITNHTR